MGDHKGSLIFFWPNPHEKRPNLGHDQKMEKKKLTQLVIIHISICLGTTIYIYIYILEHQHALLERRVSAIALRVHMYPLSRHVWNASLGSC